MGNSNNHPERPSSDPPCPRCGMYHPPYSGSGSSVPNLDYARGGGSLSSGQHLLYARGGGSGSSVQNLPYAKKGEDILSRQSNPARDLSDIPLDSGENVADSEMIACPNCGMYHPPYRRSTESGGNRAYGKRGITLIVGENGADSEYNHSFIELGLTFTDIKLESEEELAVKEQSDIKLDSEEELAVKEQSDVICQYHLRGKCSWGSSCRDVHCDLPYQWRLRRRGSQVWTYFSEDDNDGIERAFCDPTNEKHNVFNHEMAIDFNSMTGKDNVDCQFEIERLSTPSSVNHGHQSWRTKWLWYWRNPKGEWIKFEDRDNYEGCIALIKSVNLEEAFVANPTVLANFMTTGKNSFVYIVNFRNMTQFNTKDGTIRELRRRPEFINKNDFKLKLLGSVRNADNAVTNGIKAPDNWSIPNGTDLTEHNELVPLKQTDKYYDEIEKLFFVENAVILSIDRIENGDLWEKYMMKKSKMLEKKNEEQLGEKRVFHGTDNNNVPAICEQGFDVRLAGTANGTDKGKGCYFAKDSTKAHDYTSKGTEYSTMFVTKILPGEYVRGNSSFDCPPNKYDSCVDDVKYPKTFVIFDNNQMYPEYVIRYKVMNIDERITHSLKKNSQKNCELELVESDDKYTE